MLGVNHQVSTYVGTTPLSHASDSTLSLALEGIPQTLSAHHTPCSTRSAVGLYLPPAGLPELPPCAAHICDLHRTATWTCHSISRACSCRSYLAACPQLQAMVEKEQEQKAGSAAAQ